MVVHALSEQCAQASCRTIFPFIFLCSFLWMYVAVGVLSPFLWFKEELSIIIINCVILMVTLNFPLEESVCQHKSCVILLNTELLSTEIAAVSDFLFPQ